MLEKLKYITIGLLLFVVLFFMARTSLLEVMGPQEDVGGPLLVWHGGDESQDAILRQSVRTFVELHPNASIIVDRVEAGELKSRFEDAVSVGFGPNLLIGPSQWVRSLADQDLILPIEADLSPGVLERYFSNTINTLRYQERLYGLPLSLDTQILYYNRQLVSEPATNLDQLLTQGQSGVEIGLNSSFSQSFWGIRAFGGQLFDEEGRVVLDRGGFANWLNWLKSAQEIPSFILSTDQPTLRNLFTGGRLGYLVDSSAARPLFQASMTPDQLGIALLPSGPTGSAGPFLYTEALMFATASSPSQHTLAIELAEFLTNAEQQTTFMRQLGKTPTHSRVRINPQLNPIVSVFSSQSRTGVPFPNDPVIDEIRRLGNDGLIRALEGILTPVEAAREATAEINRIIGFEVAEVEQVVCNNVGDFTFWYAWEGVAPAVMESLLADFRQACPNIYIRGQAYSTDELMTRLSGSVEIRLPELILIPHARLRDLADLGAIQPIGPLIEPELLQRYRPTALNAFRYNGRLYGLPLSLRTDALLYNLNRVDSAPATLTDLLRQGEQGASLGQNLSFRDAFWGLQTQGGVSVDPNGEILLDEVGFARWLEWMRAAQISGAVTLSADSVRLDEAFAQGELAYRVASANKLPGFIDALGRENLGIAPLPAGDVGDAGPLIRVSGFVLGNANESRIPAALDFIRYMTGQQAQQQVIERASLIPSNASVELAPGSPLAPYAAQLTSAILYPNAASFSAMAEFGGDAYVWTQSGVLGAEEAAREAVALIRQSVGTASVDPEVFACAGTGDVALWHTWPGDEGGDILQALINRFASLCGEIDVTLTYLSPEALAERLLSPIQAPATDNGADPLAEGVEEALPATLLILAPGELLDSLHGQNLLTPAQSLVDTGVVRRMIPVALETVSREGTLYGLPVSMDTLALFVNRGAPTVATLDDLVQEARIGNRAALVTNGGNGVWGLGGFAGPLPEGGAGSALVQRSWPEQAGAAGWFAWLQEVETLSGIQLETESRRALALFTNQRLAYYMGDSRDLAALMAQMSAGQFEVTRLPAGPNGPATPLLRSDALFFPRSSFGINDNGEGAAAALSVALYLSSTEAQTLLLESGERIPANRLVDATRQPLAQAFIAQAASALPHPLPGGDALLTTLAEITRAVLAGELSPQQAAEQLFTR